MSRSQRVRITIAAAMAALLVLGGTLGIRQIEGISLFDAFYQTVVTIATAGIQGSQAATTAGKLLTITLLGLGGSILVYVLGTTVRLVLEGEFSRYFGGQRMRKQIDSLRDHFIICGFGRVGQEVAVEFAARSLPFVIVDNAADMIALARQRGFLVLDGDATLDEVLEAAGVRRARCLIASSGGDAQNTYITLSAKSLNPKVFIVARSSQEGNERKLRQAGADRVVSPYSIAGRHIALSAVQPLILDFMTEPQGNMRQSLLAQILVKSSSSFAGGTIADVLASCNAITVLGLRHPTGELIVGPSPAQRIEPGDELIVVGPEPDLERLGVSRNEGAPAK